MKYLILMMLVVVSGCCNLEDYVYTPPECTWYNIDGTMTGEPCIPGRFEKKYKAEHERRITILENK